MLIREFNQQLKSKDEEYVKSLRRQAEDIEKLLQYMRTEYTELQIQYDEQLDAIEEAFDTERAEILQSNRKEIEALFAERQRKERKYKDEKLDREAKYQRVPIIYIKIWLIITIFVGN